MRKQLLSVCSILLIVSLLLGGCTGPQPPAPDPIEYLSALEPAPPAPEGFDIAAVLEYLCSTAFGGRQTGTEGCTAAGDYAAGFLEEWGYQPLFGDSLAVPYTAVVGDPALAESEIILHLPDGDITLTEGVDYTFSFHLEDIDATLPLSTDPAACANGEAVLLWKKGVKRDDAKITLAQAGGVLNAGSDVLGNGNDRLEDRRITLSDNAFALAEQAESITLRLKASAKEMERNNYCAVLPGTDRTQAMVLCAHIDGTGTWGEVLYPSAHDNASGTVALLECARQMAGYSLPYDLVFCIFTGEEQKLLGSKALAPVLESHYDLINVINLDCLGCGEPESLRILGENAVTLSEGMEIYLRAAGYTVMETAIAASDQDAFTHPAIGLSELPAEGSRFHQPNDTLDTVDPASLKRVAGMVCTYVQGAELITIAMEEEAQQALEAALLLAADAPQLEAIGREVQRQELTKGFSYDQAVCAATTVEDEPVNALFTGWRMLETLDEVAQYYPELELPETVDGLDFFGAYVVHEQGAVFTEGAWLPGEKYTVDWGNQPVESVWAYYLEDNEGYLLHVGGTAYNAPRHPEDYGTNIRNGYAHRGENGKFSGVWVVIGMQEITESENGIYWDPRYGNGEEADTVRVRTEVSDTLEHLISWYAEHKSE